MVIVTFLIWSPIVLLYFVDIEEGRKEADRTLRVKILEHTEAIDEQKGLNGLGVSR